MPMTTRFRWSAAVLAAACILAPLQASAGLFDDDEARRAILDLRSKMAEKADKAGLLELSSQNEALREEVARLRGQIEVLSNEVSNLQKRQKDFYVDLDGRLKKLEPQKVVVDGKEASVEMAEQQAYDSALTNFKEGSYKNAAAGFADFLQRYPKSSYAAAAQYWLGNSYYALRDYRNAIAALNLVVKNYPDNPKAADAMLQIASSQADLKDKGSARKTLESVIAKYPGSQAAENAKQRLAQMK